MGHSPPAYNNVHASKCTDGGDINNNNNMHQPPMEDATTPPITDSKSNNVGGVGNPSRVSIDPDGALGTDAVQQQQQVAAGSFPFFQRDRGTSIVNTVSLSDEGRKSTGTSGRALTFSSPSGLSGRFESSNICDCSGGDRRKTTYSNTTHTGLVEESNGLNNDNHNPFGNNNNPVPSLLRSIRGHKTFYAARGQQQQGAAAIPYFAASACNQVHYNNERCMAFHHTARVYRIEIEECDASTNTVNNSVNTFNRAVIASMWW